MRLFNWRTVTRAHFVCNFSHRMKCLCALCRLIFPSFDSSDMFPCKCLHPETCSRASLCIKRRVSAHVVWLTKSYLYATFNIWHRVCHLTSHWCSWNDTSPRDFLTYAPVSTCIFWRTKLSLSTLLLLVRPDCEDVFTVKRHVSTHFWLTRTMMGTFNYCSY